MNSKIFLFDGLGALVSAVLLCILIYFQPFVGMPTEILLSLAIAAALFSLYSLACFAFNVRNSKYLLVIMLCNLIYCAVTLGLVLHNWSSLTMWGVTYFLGEIMIILLLVSVENRERNL